MRLTERTIISSHHPRFKEYMEYAHLSKNLYNASLYDVRQHYFKTDKHKTWQTQRPEFAGSNPDYVAMPAKVAGEVIKDVGRDFSSFFALIKKKKKGNYKEKVRIPGYKDKSGHHVVTFPKDTISKEYKDLGNGYYEHTLCSRSWNITVISEHKDIDIVRMVPRGDHIVMEVIYTVSEVEEKEDNYRYAAIDIGINNLVALVDNVGNDPLLFSGRAIKSINQSYNKEKAKYMSLLPKGVKTSEKIKSLGVKRMRRIDWFLHNISSSIVNHLVSNDINTLVIGYNKGWKQDIKMGKIGNQRFVSVPFARLIDQLKYKCALLGIRVIITEESYTSKCSFLDKERVGKHESYAGRRVHRGLFKSSSGVMLNADVNGAFNIMRKVVPDEFVYLEGVVAGAVRASVVNVHLQRQHK